MKKLTPKQLLFIKEYLVDKNATQAAIRAGYSSKRAKEIGYENLTKPHIKQLVNEEIEKQIKRIEVTADKVIQEIAKLAFANMENYITVTADGNLVFDFSNMTSDQMAAIQEVTVDEFLDRANTPEGERVRRTKFKLSSKRGSLELLGKHLALFTDKKVVAEVDDSEFIKQFFGMK